MVRIALCALTVLAVLGSGATARGQWFDPSCCAPPVCPQVQMCSACQPVVQQQCYQTIPVTEYQEVRQTVQRPVVETTYVDQPCTEYRQVYETKTAQIPTCQYQTVTEMKTVQRDMGCWVTQYQCNPRLAPCQYDSRPNLFGFLNRTGYSMRMAFTPPMTATRTWKPNIVAMQVPVQRQVAIHGTQQVSYQVPRMVAHTTTRKVAVNNVRMVAQEIVTKQPVTVYRTVPAGTATAFGGPIFGGTVIGSTILNSNQGTATALQPTPVEPRVNQYKQTSPTATAERPSDVHATPVNPNRNNLPDALKNDEGIPQPVERPSSMRPLEIDEDVTLTGAQEIETRKPVQPAQVFASRPSVARVGRWMARRSLPAAESKASVEMLAENRK